VRETSKVRKITSPDLGIISPPSTQDRGKKGLGPAKGEVKAIRELWAGLTNGHLLERGLAARVDHRTLEAQGIERAPTTHLGVAVWGMERRGIETRVGLRVREQQRLEVQSRLERAAEFGRLGRERRALEASILDLSGDLRAARREAEQPQPKETLEDVQRQAREQWLAMRAADPDAHLSSEERQQQAAERWAEYRRQQLIEPSREAPENDRDIEKDQEKKRDHGIDDDFGL
jgi:hypothetical protein